MADIVTDADGRELELREPAIREKMKLIRSLGAAADIQMYLGQVMIAAMVAKIDGTPMILPNSPEMADGLVEKVGNAGADAVSEWWQAKVKAREEGSADAVKKHAKN